MPPAISYTPNNEALRKIAQQELRLRRDSCNTAWQYYLGEQQQHLKVDRKGIDDNVVQNLCKQVVDRVVSFLIPDMPELELDELQDTAEEAELRAAWQENGGAELLTEIAQIGAIDGHVFVRVIEPSEFELYPKIIALDPANILVWWQADNYKNVLWYEIQFTVGEKQYRQDIVSDDDIWVINEYARDDDQATWQYIKTSTWNYPLSPIVDWQHGQIAKQRYGMSEIAHRQLNDKVNKIRSDNVRTVRYHAAPKTIGTGFQGRKIEETAIESFWTIDNPDAKVYNLEMKSDLVASEGLAQTLRDEFMAESRVVVMRGTVADFQRVTNLGVRALYFDQINKNKELLRRYSRGIEAISKRVRMLMGKKDYATPVKIVWADPLPVDPMERVNELTAERALGVVSKETIADDLGRNWALETERIAEEGDANAALMERFLNNAPN